MYFEIKLCNINSWEEYFHIEILSVENTILVLKNNAIRLTQYE